MGKRKGTGKGKRGDGRSNGRGTERRKSEKGTPEKKRMNRAGWVDERVEGEGRISVCLINIKYSQGNRGFNYLSSIKR